LLVTLLVFLLTAADGASSLQRKCKTTTSTSTVAGIEDYFRQVDLKQGMVDAQDIIEPYPWDAKQFSISTDPPEPIEPPTEEPLGPTPSPVPVSEECQDADRTEAMLDALKELTSESQLLNSVTPQGMAYSWILTFF